MRVERDRFMDQGYLILRGFLSNDRLEALRETYETLVERQKVRWARDRGPDDPPGGVWETARQPRLHLQDAGLVDESTRDAIEDFWIDDRTLEVASQLLSGSDPNIHNMMMMCNPVKDHPGGTGWHRDVSSVIAAPMKALQADFTENGPRYTQWNVPLYDDRALWLVPGSHARPNTEEENEALRQDRKAPPPGAMAVELQAGDAAVYTHYLLHSGLDYTTRLRRTIHGGHAKLTEYPDLTFAEALSAGGRHRFETWARQGERIEDTAEAALRAAIAGDTGAYNTAVEALEPGIGPHGKTVFTIYLSKAALLIRVLNDPAFEAPSLARQFAQRTHALTLWWGPKFAARFNKEDTDGLWRRFEPLHVLLQADEAQDEPGFQGEPTRYYTTELPKGADHESFVQGWSND